MLLCREDTVTLYHGITGGGKIQHPVKDVMIVEAEQYHIASVSESTRLPCRLGRLDSFQHHQIPLGDNERKHACPLHWDSDPFPLP